MRAKCPHCGELFSKLKAGNVPTHDFPRPCRAVCPGSGQSPRAEDDVRPLWKDAPTQRADDYFDAARQELLILGFAVCKEMASLRGEDGGIMRCPLCLETLHFSIAPNGHCHASCTRKGCIRASE